MVCKIAAGADAKAAVNSRWQRHRNGAAILAESAPPLRRLPVVAPPAIDGCPCALIKSSSTTAVPMREPNRISRAMLAPSIKLADDRTRLNEKPPVTPLATPLDSPVDRLRRWPGITCLSFCKQASVADEVGSVAGGATDSRQHDARAISNRLWPGSAGRLPADLTPAQSCGRDARAPRIS